MLIEVLLSGAAGFCAKACDEFCERKFSSKKIAILAAIIYPLTLAFLTSTTPLSSLFLALAIASIFAGKIDHYMHLFSLSLYTLLVLVLPLNFFSLPLFALFLASAFLDEIKIPFKCFSFFSKNRLFAPLAAFFIFLFSGQYIFLIALASFDMAYRAFKVLLKYRAGASGPQAASKKTRGSAKSTYAPPPPFLSYKPFSLEDAQAKEPSLQKPPMAQNSPLSPIPLIRKKIKKKKPAPQKITSKKARKKQKKRQGKKSHSKRKKK
ncbi:hypothetical protein COU37_03010 [Candidatus Micrarchaeota archaeon CG10_big_fil_rev_8_21_14_0_10_45_29]|nr:MAG: hypothetical protein COU37_03010 [Candidatus Micrarchaeota archaeon CG10_big_fil_rev_8_21_14_0_10_45_29]